MDVLISKALIIIPKIALIHIQNIAPAPPMLKAPATPAIFPVPTVAERAVQADLKEVTSFEFLRYLKALAVIFKESVNFVICENLVLKEKQTPEIIKKANGKVDEIKFSKKSIYNTRNKFINLLIFLCFTVYWVLFNFLFCVTIYNV